MSGLSKTDYLQSYIDRCKSIFVQLNNSNVRGYWLYGQTLAEMRDSHPEVDSIRELTNRLEWPYSTAIKAVSFHAHFEEQALDELLDMRLPNGSPVLWTHIFHLVSVADLQQRQRLLQAVVDEGLTPADLHKRLLQEAGGSRRLGSGRPHKSPASLREFIADSSDHVGGLKRRLAAYSGGMDSLLQSADKGELKSMQQMAKDVGELQASLSKMLKKVMETISRLREQS